MMKIQIVGSCRATRQKNMQNFNHENAIKSSVLHRKILILYARDLTEKMLNENPEKRSSDVAKLKSKKKKT